MGPKRRKESEGDLNQQLVNAVRPATRIASPLPI
jgi:hypothetical protein